MSLIGQQRWTKREKIIVWDFDAYHVAFKTVMINISVYSYDIKLSVKIHPQITGRSVKLNGRHHIKINTGTSCLTQKKQ